MEKRRTWKKIIKYAVITAAAVLLFGWGRQAAFAQRGYAAAGGEYLLLLLPLMWYAAERTAREFIRELKSVRKGRTSYED